MVFSNRTNAQGGLSECEDIRDLAYAGDVEQPWFAAIAKYVIMGLSALYIVREVSIPLLCVMFSLLLDSEVV